MYVFSPRCVWNYPLSGPLTPESSPLQLIFPNTLLVDLKLQNTHTEVRFPYKRGALRIHSGVIARVVFNSGRGRGFPPKYEYIIKPERDGNLRSGGKWVLVPRATRGSLLPTRDLRLRISEIFLFLLVPTVGSQWNHGNPVRGLLREPCWEVPRDSDLIAKQS